MRAQVVIAGGGPVGMGLGIELAQRGIDTIVVEKHSRPLSLPRGQNLTQRTMEHFHFWGCEPQLRAARTIPSGFGSGGIAAYGCLLSGRHHDWLQRNLLDQYYCVANERLPQYQTENVLRARAARLDNLRVMYDWTVGSITQDPDGVAVTATSTAHRGEPRTLEAQYLVGCDGCHSTVREQAGITQSLETTDKLMALVVFRSPELDGLLLRFPGKAFFKILPAGLNGYWRFFGRVDADSTWFFHTPVSREDVERGLDTAALLHSAIGATFEFSASYTGLWEFRFAQADTYRSHRVFMAGDAAHSHPPYGGYGINSGFEDARNLGWKLAASIQGWGGAALLDSYDSERRPVMSSTMDDFIRQSIEDDAAFLQRLEQFPAHALDAGMAQERADAARRDVLRFAPHYCGSSIVFGSSDLHPGAVGFHVPTALAGRHLAPQKLSDGRSLYEALDSSFALICFADDFSAGAAFSREARMLGMPLTLIHDSNEAARTSCGADLILLRPDNFVAWSSNDIVADPRRILARAIGQQAQGA